MHVRFILLAALAAVLGFGIWRLAPGQPAPFGPFASSGTGPDRPTHEGRAREEAPPARAARTTAPARLLPRLAAVPTGEHESPPASDARPTAPVTLLAPELGALWPHEVEAKLRADFERFARDRAQALGLPESFHARFVAILTEQRKRIADIANRSELQELPPDEADRAIAEVERETREKRAQLFAAAGVQDDELLRFQAAAVPPAGAAQAQPQAHPQP